MFSTVLFGYQFVAMVEGLYVQLFIGDTLQKVDSNMASSETFIRDRGISVFMMSDVREVT